MQTVKLCKDCRWSKPEQNFEWNLRCLHPKVNEKDPYALSQSFFIGSECRDERSKGFLSFPACGMKGKLWEQK